MSNHTATVPATRPNPFGDTTYCRPGHHAGSKPQIIPVPGNNDRPAGKGLWVIYHGHDYLDGEGRVVRHPVRLVGWNAAAAAIGYHEYALAKVAGQA